MIQPISRVFPLIAGLMFLAVSPASAQDPVKTLPEAYTLQFENEWVRVVRVHYAAGAKLASHTHPAGTTAYVYLSDSDGVIFRHSGRSSRTVTRPPVKAGSLRVAAGNEETHTAENPASSPSDFLRLQVKTEARGARTERRRISRGSYAAGEALADVQFTSGQLRITRIIVPPGQATELVTTATEPALLIALSASGQERWIGTLQRETISNTAAAPIEFLRFDFLTAPAAPGN